MSDNDVKKIVEHVKNASGRKIGTLVAIKGNDGRVYIGWSKCMKFKVLSQPIYDEHGKQIAERITDGDHFNPTVGHVIAMERAVNAAINHIPTYPVPTAFKRPLRRFIARAYKYFNTLNIVVPDVVGYPEKSATV